VAGCLPRRTEGEQAVLAAFSTAMAWLLTWCGRLRQASELLTGVAWPCQAAKRGRPSVFSSSKPSSLRRKGTQAGGNAAWQARRGYAQTQHVAAGPTQLPWAPAVEEEDIRALWDGSQACTYSASVYNMPAAWERRRRLLVTKAAILSVSAISFCHPKSMAGMKRCQPFNNAIN